MITYDIHATNFTFELILEKCVNWPIWQFEQPYQTVEITEHDNNRCAVVNIPVSDQCHSIILTRSGKFDMDTVFENGLIIKDQKLIINKIWVNGVLLEKQSIDNQTQIFPEYDQCNRDYAMQHDINLPELLFGFILYYNGIWKLNFEQPFFQWYNQLILNKLRSTNHWVRESHLGFADDQHITKLKKLINNIS